MNPRKLLKVAFALCALLLPWLSHAEQFADREKVRDTVRSLFYDEKFAELEKMYAEMVANDSRFPSGTYIADDFIYGLEDLTNQSKLFPLPRGVAKPPPGHSPAKEGFYVYAEAKAERWKKEFPTSSLAASALATTYIGHGFSYRGTRIARDTDPEALDHFSQYIRKAQSALLDPLVVKDAAWYMAVFNVAPLSGVDLGTLGGLIEEATDKYPQRYGIYFTASWALQPKWGGSLDAYDWLADLAVRKTRMVSGSAMYARIYWNVSSFTGADFFNLTHASWVKMRPSFDDLIKAYPDPWNINNYAKFACMARDGATVKTLFKRIGNALDPVVWDNDSFLVRCRGMADES